MECIVQYVALYIIPHIAPYFVKEAFTQEERANIIIKYLFRKYMKYHTLVSYGHTKIYFGNIAFRLGDRPDCSLCQMTSDVLHPVAKSYLNYNHPPIYREVKRYSKPIHDKTRKQIGIFYHKLMYAGNILKLMEKPALDNIYRVVWLIIGRKYESDFASIPKDVLEMILSMYLDESLDELLDR